MHLRHIASSLIVSASLVAGLIARQAAPAQLAFEAARKLEVIDHDLPAAIVQYRAIATKYAADRSVVPEALLRLAGCQEQLGQPEARGTYERLVKDYPDSAPAKAARLKLAASQQPGSGLGQMKIDTDAATPSPDGRYLTFVDSEAGDLAIKELKSGKTRRLTANKDKSWFEFADSSVSSGDGRQIAYTWFRGNDVELRIINAAGGTPQVLAQYQRGGIEPLGFSKDGREILFSAGDGAIGPPAARTTQFLMVSANGGEPRVVKTVSEASSRASWSPDRQYIVFDAPRTPERTEHGLFIMRADGTSVEPLTTDTANEEVLDWFPDGKRLLFVSDRRGINGIWATRMADGKPVGEPELVQPMTGRLFGQGFTPDGTYYYRLLAPSEDVRVFRLDATGALSGKVEPLKGRFEGRIQGAVWSPDGSQIAYAQSPFEIVQEPSLCIRTSAGQVHTIPINLATIANPAWMPDGQGIIVEGTTAEGRQGLFRIALGTGEVSVVGDTSADRAAEKRFPAVTKDGREVLYALGQGRFGIQARDLVSGAVRMVFDEPVYTFAISPDGRFVAAGPGRSGTPSVRVVPVVGGSSSALAAQNIAVEAIGWSADGRYVYISSAARGFLRVPVDGGPVEPKGLVAPGAGQRITRMSANPTGLIAISTWQWNGGNWIIWNIPKPKSR